MTISRQLNLLFPTTTHNLKYYTLLVYTYSYDFKSPTIKMKVTAYIALAITMAIGAQACIESGCKFSREEI